MLQNKNTEPIIIYLKKDFTPTDEAGAELVKIIYPDGRVVFGVPTKEETPESAEA